MRESRRRLRTFCRSIARIVLALASTLVGTAIAVAQSVPNDGPHVTASLISETRNIVAGQPLHLALRQQIQPGWHTYWSNPGKSGLPTTIDWSLPRGLQTGANHVAHSRTFRRPPGGWLRLQGRGVSPRHYRGATRLATGL